MSTNYYGLRSPFTGATIARDDGVSVIRLTARDDTAAEVRCSAMLEGVILLALADRDEQIARRSGGHVSAAHYLPDSLQLISEYGYLTTLGDVRRGVAP